MPIKNIYNEHKIYNLDYFEGYLRRCSKHAEKISKIRWDFIKEVNPKTVLDYGSGVGWFRAFRPNGVRVDSYDIGNYPQTGILCDKYQILCLWDVLEHIPDFREIEFILKETQYVALTVPIKPPKIKIENWKHFKPNEHLHYFTIESLDALFKRYNFKKIKHGYPECPPREDILSALYQKRERKIK